MSLNRCHPKRKARGIRSNRSICLSGSYGLVDRIAPLALYLDYPKRKARGIRSAESISSFIFWPGYSIGKVRVALFSLIALALFSLIAIILADNRLALFYVIAWP